MHSAAVPITTHATRQPKAWPRKLAIGMPMTEATVSPVNTAASARARRSGGTIAAPAFGRIAARAAAYLNLQPTEPLPEPLADAKR